MVSRLDRETEPYHHAADSDRMSIMTPGSSPASYLSFLSRIYGFEGPVEAALAMTPRLDTMLDLRGRTRIRLLRADLFALGIVDAATLPRCPSVFPFRHAAAALGWTYAIERNRRLHGIIERHLDDALPDQPRGYFAVRDRSAGERWRELGDALDRIGRVPAIGDQIVLAARSAFRCQHSWYQLSIPQRRANGSQHAGDRARRRPRHRRAVCRRAQRSQVHPQPRPRRSPRMPHGRRVVHMAARCPARVRYARVARSHGSTLSTRSTNCALPITRGSRSLAR